MSFSILPPELLDGVASHLSLSDLTSFARLSYNTYPVAQRLLYRNLVIAPEFHNYSVIFALANKPAIARYVRSFSITVKPDSTLFRAFYQQLAKALSLMTELVSLRVFVHGNASWILQTAQTRVFCRLNHFASGFSFDSHVAQFLEKTPALLELELDSTNPCSFPVNPLSIPNLTHLTGSTHLAELVIPGRPVNTVHLTDGEFTERVIDSIASSTATVKILGVSTCSSPHLILNRLPQSVPHLVHLRLMTTSTFEVTHDVLFYDIAHALAGLPNLQTFELSGMHWGSADSHNAGEDDMRIWQSKPLNVDTNEENGSEDNPEDVDSDLFFQF